MGQGVSAIKAELSEGKHETYVMRQRMKHYVTADEGGRWSVFNGSVDLGEETPSAAEKPLRLKMATWNIWFDRQHLGGHRWASLFDQLFKPSEETAPYDVVALQEVISQSYQQLLGHADVQRDWIVTDFTDIAERTGCWYGTMLLVRKSWLRANGLERVDASLTRYDSPQLRSLLALELATADGVSLRIGTSHFESAPQDVARRRRQFYTAARLLTFPSLHNLTESPTFPRTNVDEFVDFLESRAESGFAPEEISDVPPSILCGDTNIEGYDELHPLLSSPLGYIDAFSSIHPPSTSDPSSRDQDIYISHPTFGTTYTEDPIPVLPKRIDYILAHEGGRTRLRVLSARTIGGEPCRGVGSDGQVHEDVCKGGKGGKMYPSDHLGVIVELEFSKS